MPFSHLFISVNIFRSTSPKRRKRSPTPKPCKIHIGRLTRNVTKEHVTEIFSIYGIVKSVEMPTDRTQTHLSRGFAYVEYEKAEDAESAMKHMDGGTIVIFLSILFLLKCL